MKQIGLAIIIWTNVLSISAVANSFDVDLLQGAWESHGYGRIFHFEQNEVSIYSVTKVSCAFAGTYTLNQFLPQINRLNISEDGTLSYFQAEGITRYEMTPLQQLPEPCSNSHSGTVDADPEYIFEAFWHSFKENYAFFELRNTNWDQIYLDYRPKVAKNTSDAQLYEIFAEIILQLNDRHVSLEGKGFKTRYSGNLATLAALYDKEMPDESGATREKIIKAANSILADHYLNDTRHESPGGLLTWGWAAEGVGYLGINSLANFPIEEGNSKLSNAQMVDQIMDQVLSDLEGAAGFIIDNRWNGGGFDSNALRISGRFTDKQRYILSKRVKHAHGESNSQRVYVAPSGEKQFTGPIVYLSSKDTLSAAEIFSLAMLAFPNVVAMGDASAGALSDTLGVTLPNGWKLRLSNETYTAVDDKEYEGFGVPVDVVIPIHDQSILSSYLRQGMDTAISNLKYRMHSK